VKFLKTAALEFPLKEKKNKNISSKCESSLDMERTMKLIKEIIFKFCKQ